MLKLEHIKKTFNKGSANEVVLFTDLNVAIEDEEFVTIIGSMAVVNLLSLISLVAISP